MKARLVAKGRMQDCTVYPDYSSPTIKTKSVNTCLKLAAVKDWQLMKIGMGGPYLCANIDEQDEMFMVLDRTMATLCQEWLPDVKQYIREDGK